MAPFAHSNPQLLSIEIQILEWINREFIADLNFFVCHHEKYENLLRADKVIAVRAVTWEI